MSEYQKQLASMKKTWKSSKKVYDTMFAGAKVPEGVYIAQVQKCALKESKSSGNLMIARQHLILEGEYKGTMLFDNMQLETEYGPVFARKWIETVGYETPEDIEELPELLEAIASEGPVCKVAVKHSGDFVNVNVSEMLDSGILDELGISTTVDPDEEDSTSDEGDDGDDDDDDGSAEQEEDVEVVEEEKPKAKAKAKAKAKPKAKSKKESLSEKDLKEFCVSQDIDFEDSDDFDTLKELISEFTYNRSELDAKEVKLLEALGLGDDIED